MDAKVLDSWAILAWMKNEARGSKVRDLFDQAGSRALVLHCSAINAGEVYYHLARLGRRTEAELFWGSLISGNAPLRLAPATVERIRTAAEIKATYPLAYADAFAVALAREMSCALVTGDPEIRRPADDGLIAVEWL